MNSLNINIQNKEIENLKKIRRKYIIVLIIIILIILLSVYYIYIYEPINIINIIDKINKFGINSNFIMLIIALMIIYIILLIISSIINYNYIINNSSKINDKNIFHNFLKYFYIFCAFILSGFIIYFMLYYLGLFNKEDTNKYSIIILNILLLSTIIGIVYKIFYTTYESFLKNNLFFNIIIKTLLYIPYLLITIIYAVKNIFYKTDSNNNNDYKFLIFSLIIITSYFIFYNYGYPYISRKYYKQGGLVLVNYPINIIKEKSILIPSTKSNNTNYNYALSFWFYIDSFPPNTSSSYLKQNSIISISDNINIKYDPIKNLLIVEVKENNNINIIYKNDNVLLQKWNNIIMNYNSGVLDIFYNGKLVNSEIEIISYIENNIIKIGENNGINGSLCNLLYFNKSLDILTIDKLYNSLKNANPPIVSNSNEF